jgi:hypothetical protein
MTDKFWRGLAWAHRWTGVGLCLLFAMWFASGAIMVFVPYPSLSETARWAARAPIVTEDIVKAPSDVLNGNASALRLIGIEGRPVYVVSHEGSTDEAIAADTGTAIEPISAAMAVRIAQLFMHGQAQGAPQQIDYDQWVVAQGFDPLRPFFKVPFSDPGQTELYVSSRTGEIVQRTSAATRFWNGLGSVLHWIYFTPIRKSWALWDGLVWWISLAGIGLTVAGFVLGIYRSAAMRGRRRGLSPFRQWLRWHHIVGLFAGVFILTWIVSGWLSMDHGRLFPTGDASREEIARMMGAPLAETLRSVPARFLQTLVGPAEVRFGTVASKAIVTAGMGDGSRKVYISGNAGFEARDEIPQSLMTAGIDAAWPDAGMRFAGAVPDDDYYAMAEEMGGALRLFTSRAGKPLSIYVDGRSGRIVKVMDGRRRLYDWLYYTLHTLRVPGSGPYDILRVSIVLILMAIGFGFSITGVVLGLKRIRAGLHPHVPRSVEA